MSAMLIGLTQFFVFAGLDERSGTSPWEPGEQNSPSFSQGRVWPYLIELIEPGHVDVILLALSTSVKHLLILGDHAIYSSFTHKPSA